MRPCLPSASAIRTAPVELRECVDFARARARRRADGARPRGTSRARRWCSRPATAPRSTPPRTSDARRRGSAAGSSANTTACRGTSLAPHVVRLPRRRGRRSPVPRRRRPRLARRRRAADPRPGEGRATPRRPELKITGALTNRLFTSAFRVGKRVRTRNGPRRRRGVGQLRGDRAGEEDLRRARRAERPDPRRRRDGASSPASHLQAQGVKQLTIASRTLRRARERSRRHLGGRAVPWARLGDALGRRRHRRHRDRRARAGADPRAGRRGDAAAAQPAAVHHRHRRAARRRARGRRPRPGVPLQHRRPAGDREGEPGAPQPPRSSAPKRSSARKSDRFGAWMQSREVVPTVVALRAALRGDPPGGAEAAGAEAGGAAARSARAGRRDHPPDRREAAADADRTAEGRPSDETLAVAYCGCAQPPVQPAATTGRTTRRRVPAGEVARESNRLRIGTRGSALALWQANAVAGAARQPAGATPSIVIIKTTGDRLQDAPLSRNRRQGAVRQGDRGRAARAATIDLAVHSAKDMSVAAAGRPRRSRRCCRARIRATRWSCRRWHRRRRRRRHSTELGASPTSAPAASAAARSCAATFPDARVPADPRQRRHAAAQARRRRVRRAGARRRRAAAARPRGPRISAALPHDDCVPAPGQGIVAIEIRADDDARDEAAGGRSTTGRRAAASTAERARRRGARRRLPAAARRGRRARRRRARHAGDRRVARRIAAAIAPRRRGTAADPAALGRRLADELARAGAIEILESSTRTIRKAACRS